MAAATFSMVGALAFAARPASALPVEGFTGAFAVSNWLLNPLSSIVDVAGAPKSISISSQTMAVAILARAALKSPY